MVMAWRRRDKHRTTMHLALELYQLIFQHVDSRADLYRLLFVSRTVSSEAERALYHTIRVINQESSIPSRQSMSLYFHLINCPRVATYVRELEISGGTLESPTYHPFRFHDRLPRNYFRIINRVLRALTHLQVLTLSTWVRQTLFALIFPSSTIFLKCTFSLKVLKYAEYEQGEFPRIDLTQLKELSLVQRHYQVLRCQPDTFTSLQILSATTPQFRTLGTSNTARIKALCLQASYTGIAGTLPDVVSLKADSETQTSLTPFPSLRFLQIIVSSNDILIDTRFSQLLHRLTNLKNLEALCFVTAIRFPLDLHLKFFAAISNLKELILLNNQSGLLWEKDLDKPVHIQPASVTDEWKNPRWLQD